MKFDTDTEEFMKEQSILNTLLNSFCGFVTKRFGASDWSRSHGILIALILIGCTLTRQQRPLNL